MISKTPMTDEDYLAMLELASEMTTVADAIKLIRSTGEFSLRLAVHHYNKIFSHFPHSYIARNFTRLQGEG